MSSTQNDGVRRSTRTPRTSKVSGEPAVSAPRSARKTRGTTPVIPNPSVDSGIAHRREVLSGRNQGYGTIGEGGVSIKSSKVATQQQVASTLEEAVGSARENLVSSTSNRNIQPQGGGTDDNRSNRSSRRSRQAASRSRMGLDPVVEEKAERSLPEEEEEEDQEEGSDEEEVQEEEDEEPEAEADEEGRRAEQAEQGQNRQGFGETWLHRTFNMEGRTRNSGDIATHAFDEGRPTRQRNSGWEIDGTSHRHMTTSQRLRHLLLTILPYFAVALLAVVTINWHHGRPFLEFSPISPGNTTFSDTAMTSQYAHSIKTLMGDVTKLGSRLSSLETAMQNDHSDTLKLQDNINDIARLIRKSKPDSHPIRQVNFLSPLEMATVDLRLTSPTATRPIQGWAMGAVAKLSGGILADTTTPLGKFDYLQEDTTIIRRNWCSNSVSGVAQKGWQLGYNITPTELVLSWPSKSETIDGRSAPKDIELWVDLASNNNNNEGYIRDLKTLADKTWPGILDPPTIPPFKSSPHAQNAPSNNLVPWTMVPLGRWRYDFHANKREQRFEVGIHLGQHKTDRVAVRVTSNWGSRRMVCLQGVALHGVYRGEVIEYSG